MITLGSKPELIPSLIDQYTAYSTSKDESSILNGTFFVSKQSKLDDKKWWIKHGLSVSGSIYVDRGAVESILKQKKSLFAAGIVRVEGTFAANQCISIKTNVLNEKDQEEEIEIARGLSNYNWSEVGQLIGTKSNEIFQKLGYMDSEWIIHRGNLAIMVDSIEYSRITLLPRKSSLST